MSPIEKPAYGSPCNSCGLCCRNEICPMGQIVFPRAVAPCPALQSDGEREICGLIADPGAYAPIRTSLNGAEAMSAAAARGIGAGIGCDARIEGEANNPPASFVWAMRKVEHSAMTWRARILRLWSNAR